MALFTRNTKSEKQTELLHDAFFNSLREKEYHRLDTQQQTYLDYTGGNLYGESQLLAHQKLLRKNVFGNPHSSNPTSQLSTTLVHEARQKVIEFFNAHDYHCIFTQNASGALKIVGECYPFDEESQYLLLSDNHNSVNGIREYCKLRGGEYKYALSKVEDLTIAEDELNEDLESFKNKKNKLFAFPAQSNVTGVKHDLGWIKKAQNEGWDVLLDAAAYVPTSRLDLVKVQPEFVTISFYKIFGYPTGLGCLLVRKDAFNKLEKRWFAGGTVTLASVLAPNYVLANNYERYENGTINYLDIPAIKIGLEYIESIGMERINERIHSLITYLIRELNQLTYDSGQKMVRIFGPENRDKAGGSIIVAFLHESGDILSFEEVEAIANEKQISIRSGCFCNPGIDEVNYCITNDELAKFFQKGYLGDYKDMLRFLNKVRGATRVSVGIPTTKKDLDTFIQFVSELKNRNVRSALAYYNEV